MASNVSNLLKEKIVTPVANSVAAQVDNKVKNGIILRKFIGVQLGESNTGCQLVKIDLNKINVKDPSYEFTLYIKAFSQKGLFNFIINVNKTDSLQVDVKCEVKNSDSINGEVIGYYDVDAVGNTITISLVKDFVLNTSINECKFVSTKDTLMISDLDIDWSDTGNIKTTSSIDIRYNQTSIYEYDEYFYTYKPDFADGEMYQIAKFDFSEILNETLTGNKNFNIIIDIIYHLVGEFHICFDLSWIRNMNMINLIQGAYEKIAFQSTMERRNFDELFKFCRKDNTTLLLLINPPVMYMSGGRFVIRRIEVHRADADIESDLVKIDLTPEKIVNSDGSLTFGSIKKHRIDFSKVFTPSDHEDDVMSNGVVPYPTTSEAENKYLLGADAKWHPRKTENEYIADLKPTEEIKGLSETDTTKGISFVTFDFNTLSQKVVEAAPSTVQEFDINMEILVKDLGIIIINASFSVTTAGLVACNGVLSDRGMGRNSVSFSTAYSGKLGAVTTPGFFVNDKDTKICKIALYTPIAIDGVKIIDAVVTSYSDIITESDIVFTWELGILEKKPYKPLTSNIIYPRIDLDRELVFDQMNIETPISETDEDTLFAEQIKHNGLVPAPGKYEVNNKYLLGADGNWYPRKAGNEYIANLKPTAEILELTETDITKGVSFVTIDFNALSQKIVEATPSTYQEFDISMEILVRELGIISINASFSVTTAGVIACTGVFSNRGLKSVNFSITFDSKIGSTPSPGFFVNDYDTKIFKLALYTVFANNGVKIIDAQITSFSDLISENDITFTWELGVLDKLPAQIGRSAEIYLGVDLPRNQTFRQMNIETPITETEETVVEAERLKYNGLVPAPGKYEVNNGYFLKADGTWDKPGMVGTEDDIKRAYILRPDGSWGERGYDVSVSDIILDPSFMMDGNYLRVMSIDISDLWEDTGSMKTDLINVDFRYEIRTTNGLSEGELTAGLKFKSTGELEYHNINLYFENIYPYDMYATLGCGGINVDRTNKKIDLYINPWNITTGDQESYRIKSAYCSIGGNTKPSIDLTPTLTESSTLTEFIDAVLNDRILGFKTFETWDITGTYEDSPSSEIPDDLNTLYNLQRFRYNGLVPSPSPKDVENGCFLKADGSWDLPKRQVQDAIATVTPTSEMISQVEAAKTTKLISFLTIDVTDVASSIEKAERFVFSLDVLTNNFGLVRIGFNLMITATGNSNISSFSSNLGTNLLPVQLTHITNLKDYGVETMSAVFAISDTNNKGIFNIGFNGNTMEEKVIVLNMSCIPKQSTVEYKAFNYIFESTLIDLDSSTTIRRLNSTMIGGYMDPSNVFGSIAEITSEEIVNETDPYDLKMKKLRKNGLVPAPYQYEADQGRVLCADGTWSSANDIMTSITTNPEDEGKVLKAHNGSVIWATLINGEEVGY